MFLLSFRGDEGVLRTVRLREEVSPAVRKWWSRSDHSDGSAEDACLTLSSMLLQDKETGFHRGFCWVGFTSEEGLNNALQKEPHVLEGAKVRQGLVGVGVFIRLLLVLCRSCPTPLFVSSCRFRGTDVRLQDRGPTEAEKMTEGVRSQSAAALQPLTGQLNPSP